MRDRKKYLSLRKKQRIGDQISGKKKRYPSYMDVKAKITVIKSCTYQCMDDEG